MQNELIRKDRAVKQIKEDIKKLEDMSVVFPEAHRCIIDAVCKYLNIVCNNVMNLPEEEK